MIVRIASVQMDVAYNDLAANVGKVASHLRSLAAEGGQVAVFPECALTGYCVGSPEDASSITRTVGVLEEIQAAIDETGLVAVVGFAEAGLFNTAALFEPGVPIRYYRKTHLPELGYDRFTKTGDELPVFETRFGKIGIQICFDVRFPEASRVLALKGADMILLPTNWPTGADISADVLCVARAVENKVFVATANRVGTENGYAFIGKSKLIAPSGKLLAAAGDGEEVLVAEFDLEQARNKRNVTVAGKHETTVFLSRRPELYGEIIAPVVPFPGELL